VSLLAQAAPYVLFGLIGAIVAFIVALVVHSARRPAPEPIRLPTFPGHTADVTEALRGYRATFAADAADPTVAIVRRHR
jgi:hypothetical protein